MADLWKVERRERELRTPGGAVVTLRSKAWMAGVAGGPIRLIWNRPVSVRVVDSTGEVEIPVRDVTRIVQLGILAGAAMGLIWVVLFNHSRR